MERDQVPEELKAQAKMKSIANSKRRNVQFAVGDLIYLKVRMYLQKSLAARPNEKLAPRFIHLQWGRRLVRLHISYFFL